MKFQVLNSLINIIEYGDGGAVRSAMNDWWGIEKTQAIAKELGLAVSELTRELNKKPFADIIITTDQPIKLDHRGCAEESEPRGGWEY